MALKDISEGISDATYDVCIIGSGPAGMTLCAELAETGKRICVLESGGSSPTPQGDSLRETISTGDIHIKLWSRERVLGGASSTWSGLSAPLDDVDFAYRPYLSHPCGWPFDLSELIPYYERVGRYGFPDLTLFRDSAYVDSIKALGEIQVKVTGLQEKVFVASDPAWDFGKKLKHLFYRPTIDLYLNATVTSLVSESDENGGTKVTGARVISPRGDKHIVSARLFVLAMGGIESTRMLLLSRDSSPSGLGNEYDQVGRYVMNHPKNYFGVLHLKRGVRELPHLFGYCQSGIAGYIGFRVDEKLQKSLGILNSYLRFEPVFPWTDNGGVFALVTFVKRMRFFLTWWKKRQKTLISLRDWNETGDDVIPEDVKSPELGLGDMFWEIISHLPSVCSYAAHRLVFKKGPLVKTVRLRNFMEMEPQSENRITLSDKTDRNGQPIAEIKTNISPLDKKSVKELHRIFTDEMTTRDIGVVESDWRKADPWPIIFDASHHLGGTCMGDDPHSSVVNRDLRLHSVENLYIASGSVFPTSGCANPTYTICALSIRLADTFKKVLHISQATSASLARKSGNKNVIIIGAGRRVRDDVVPTLEAVEEFTITGIYARRSRHLYSDAHAYVVNPLAQLTEEAIKKTDWIYVSVSVTEVDSVFRFLSALPTKQIGLIIDTPVFLWKHVRNKRYMKNFGHVVVAEDIAYLPWINPVKKYLGGKITEMTFTQSAYRYHGLALIKMLAGSSSFRKARMKAEGGKTIVSLVTRDGTGISVVEPRDYQKGVMCLLGPNGSITDDLRDSGAKIKPVISNGLCIGLDISGTPVHFTDAESKLIGLVPEDATVTSLTLQLKRIGLLTLLSGVASGTLFPRSMEEAMNDVRLDEHIHYFGRWINVA